jgi:hypothetical protein
VADALHATAGAKQTGFADSHKTLHAKRSKQAPHLQVMHMSPAASVETRLEQGVGHLWKIQPRRYSRAGPLKLKGQPWTCQLTQAVQ